LSIRSTLSGVLAWKNEKRYWADALTALSSAMVSVKMRINISMVISVAVSMEVTNCFPLVN